MTKVAYKLQNIQTIYIEKIKGEKQNFEAKLEEIIKKLK